MTSLLLQATSASDKQSWSPSSPANLPSTASSTMSSMSPLQNNESFQKMEVTPPAKTFVKTAPNAGFKNSVVWQYFITVGEFAVCNICQKRFRYTGPTSPLLYHLKRIHPMLDIGPVKMSRNSLGKNSKQSKVNNGPSIDSSAANVRSASSGLSTPSISPLLDHQGVSDMTTSNEETPIDLSNNGVLDSPTDRNLDSVGLGGNSLESVNTIAASGPIFPEPIPAGMESITTCKSETSQDDSAQSNVSSLNNAQKRTISLAKSEETGGKQQQNTPAPPFTQLPIILTTAGAVGSQVANAATDGKLSQIHTLLCYLIEIQRTQTELLNQSLQQQKLLAERINYLLDQDHLRRENDTVSMHKLLQSHVSSLDETLRTLTMMIMKKNCQSQVMSATSSSSNVVPVPAQPLNAHQLGQLVNGLLDMTGQK